jgi:hypothetical protein
MPVGIDGDFETGLCAANVIAGTVQMNAPPPASFLRKLRLDSDRVPRDSILSPLSASQPR